MDRIWIATPCIWLRKKFDMQGAAFFCERGHTVCMPGERKIAGTPQIGFFTTPSTLTKTETPGTWTAYG